MDRQLLAEAQRCLEQAHFEHALKKNNEAKALLLKALPTLNTALKTDPSIAALCNDALNLYSSITGPSSLNALNLSERLLWISSKVGTEFCPPIKVPLNHLVVESNTTLIDHLRLSPTQEPLLSHWQNVQSEDWSTTGLSELYQDYLQNCSFVASFISISNLDLNYMLNRIFPHDSNSSRFGIELNFNGTKRLVQVGNSLPIFKEEKTRHTLFIRSKTNPALLWPALIEKAFLKIKSPTGYDFPGSNFAIDTFIISGWIPQFISNVESESIEFWNHLYTNFKKNSIVLGLGINNDKINHDYSIIGMDDATRTICVKNPWKNSSLRFLKFDEISQYDFNILYVNWNPNIFKFTKELTFVYQPHLNFHELPQFSLANKNLTTIKFVVFLEKHLTCNTSDNNIVFFKSNGERLFSKRSTRQITVQDSNNTGYNYFELALEKNEIITLVVLSNSSEVINFTLHIYSNSDFELSKAKFRFKSTKTIKSEWSVESCGGNWSKQSYTKNPHFIITTPPKKNEIDTTIKCTIALLTKDSILANFQLFWDTSTSQNVFNQRNTVNREQKYNTGSIIQDMDLLLGQKYHLIVSTFDPDIIAPFQLVVNSEEAIEITRHNSRLGLFQQSFKFNWNNKTRFKLKITCLHLTTLNIHVSHDAESYDNYRPKIRANVFYKDATPIKGNAEFDDSLYGIWLDNVEANAGEIILLVERFETGRDDFQVEIGSDLKVEVSVL